MAKLTLVPKKVILEPGKLIQLANDLAKRYKDTELVLRDYGINEHEYYELEQNEFFKKALANAVLEWNRPMNSEQRCRMDAMALTEKVLPEIAKGALDEKQPLNARTDAARLLAKVAGVGEKERAESDSDRVVITINLGADEKLKFDKQVKPVEPIDITPKAVEGFNVDGN